MRRTSRALLVAGLVAGVGALAGCAHASAPAPGPSDRPAVGTAGAGSDGLTVRYLGPDGKIKTLPAEDFPR
jgi:hypothetical protein